MKKSYYLIVLALILGLILTGCSLLSNISQVPSTGQSGITYLTKIIDPPLNLVGLWHFDTDANDSTANHNDGTFIGDAHIIPAGYFSNAVSFDGIGGCVQLPASNNILNTDNFTIEAWFKTSLNHPAYGGTEGRLVNLHWKDTASTAVSLYVEKYKIGLLYNTGTMEHVWVKYDVNYYDNVWHHIAVTYDVTTYRLYYDGAEVASKVDAFGGFGTYPAFLGAYISSERFFNGSIDEVRIWNTALTADQLILYDGFSGLLAPYKGPPKAFKIGSSIPLKWQYTDLSDTAVDSSAANPSVMIKQVESNGTPVDGDPIVVDDPGSSGLRYDSGNKTWHFNWQTKDCGEAGLYNIWIINDWTGQTFGPIPIQLK